MSSRRQAAAVVGTVCRAALMVVVVLVAGCATVPEPGAASANSSNLPAASVPAPLPSEADRTTPASNGSASALPPHAPYSSAAAPEPRADRRIAGTFGRPVALEEVTIVVEPMPAGTASSCGVSTPDKTLYEVTATWSGFELIFQGLQRPDDLQSWCMDPPPPIESGHPFMVLAPVPASDPTMSLMFRIDEDPDWLWFDLS